MRRAIRILMAMLGMAACAACTSQQSMAVLYQGAAAGDGATKLTTSLLQAKTITPVDATTAYTAQLSSYGAATAVNQDIQNGLSASAISLDLQSMSGDLSDVLTQLQSLQTANPALASARYKPKRYSASPAVVASANGADVTNIIEIANLVSALSPEIAAILDPIFAISTTTATQAQVTTELSTWNTDLNTLKGLIAPAAPPVPVTSP